jgi:nitrilase
VIADKYVAAAVQATPVFFDVKATTEKAVDLIAEAAKGGAKLVAFPETWIPAYPAHIFGAAGWDDPASKAAFAHLQANAVTIPGPETDLLCAAAKRHGVHVVMGVNERDGVFSRGTLYNTQIFINDQGVLLGTHRKLMPTHAEKILWGAGDGSGLRVYDTGLGKIGGLICWEHWMPLTRFAMHAQGEQVHVAAWPELPDIHVLASRHYAFEGRCFVVCVGSYMTIADIPKDFECYDAFGAAGDFGEGVGVICPGGSGIIGPDSQWVVGPVSMCETIVYGDIDLKLIGAEQQALDSAGHYNRPDIFELKVDARPKPQVRWQREAETEALPATEPATQPAEAEASPAR